MSKKKLLARFNMESEGEEEVNMEDLVTIEPISRRHVRRFRMHGADYTIRVNMPERQPDDAIDFLDKVFAHIMDRVINDIPDSDMIGIELSWPHLENPAWVPFMLKKDFSVQQFLERLTAIFQSNESAALDEPFNITITRIEMPVGSGRRLRSCSNRFTSELEKWLTQKRCIIRIDNRSDALCLGRALVVAVSHNQWKRGVIEKNLYKRVTYKNKKFQKTEALALYKKAEVPTTTPCGLHEVQLFQKYLKDYQIIVRSLDTFGDIIFEGPNAPHEINLFHHDNHYDVVTSIPAFLGKGYYCETCKKGYSDAQKHKCVQICPCCLKSKCEIDEWIYCDECGRHMRSAQCFQNHLKTRGNGTVRYELETLRAVKIPPKSVCDRLRVCTDCEMTYNTNKEHRCGQKYCRPCRRHRPVKHLCYIPVLKTANSLLPSQSSGGVFGGKQPGVSGGKVDTHAADMADEIMDYEDSEDGEDSDADSFIDDRDDPAESESEIVARFSSDSEDENMEQQHQQPQQQQQQQQQSDGGANRNTSQYQVGANIASVDGKPGDLNDIYSFVFYDFETRQDTAIPEKEDWYVHTVNLAVAHYVCHQCCIGFELRKDCTSCYEKVFRGELALQRFCDWLLKQAGVTALAHNASGFDAVLIEKELLSRGFQLRKPVYRGRKLIGAQILVGAYGVQLLDSLNFVPAPLAAFPKLFKLEEMRKGYFPHRFNTRENRGYVGPIPDANFYNPDSMKTDARQSFYEWYDVHKNDIFDLDSELLLYCQSDVAILKEGMMAFRRMMIELADVDPFRSCMTIASVAMTCFRQNYLKQDQLGVIPRNGYTHYGMQSRVGLLWLKWWSLKHGKRVQHASNGEEFSIGPYRVDGYVREDNLVLEFLGCHFHSHPACYEMDTLNPTTKTLRKDEYERTMKRLRYIKRSGFNLECIWECEFHTMLKEQEEIAHQISSLELVSPLVPSHAFFGGRTNAYTLYYDVRDGEEIKVLDFTSLYPFVNATAVYPLKHARIITEGFEQDLSQYFGFIKVKVLPPTDLHIPLLPYRSNGKLTFPLCQTCADSMQQTPCQHSPEQRAWIGTFVSCELEKAVELGYTVLSVYEVWHWDQVAKYDAISKTGGVFTQYVKQFLKVKQEASGWPTGCDTEAKKAAYIREYEEHEGIRLEKTNISSSPLRGVAKLLLNSLWGKFAQNPDLCKTEYLTLYGELIKKLTDPSLVIRSVRIVHDRLVGIQYTQKDPKPLASENIAIAAFTTAHARLKLYSVMQQIGGHGKDKLLYSDTDSVFYIKRPGEPDPICGPFLGDLVDEYPQKKIVRFCSSGPKCYSYEFSDGTHVTKAKGITLNFRNSKEITPIKMRAIVEGNTDNEPFIATFNPSKITRHKDYGIINKPESKKYQRVYTKRVLLDNGLTIPYGYRRT